MTVRDAAAALSRALHRFEEDEALHGQRLPHYLLDAMVAADAALCTEGAERDAWQCWDPGTCTPEDPCSDCYGKSLQPAAPSPDAEGAKPGSPGNGGTR